MPVSEELKTKIDSSPIFTGLDKDDEEYESAKFELIQNLWVFCNDTKIKLPDNSYAVFDDIGFGENCQKIMIQCIETYNPNNEYSAKFTTYFYSALEKTVRVNCTKEKVNNDFSGITHCKSKRKLYRDICRYAESVGIDLKTLSGREKIAECLSIELNDLEITLNEFNQGMMVNIDVPLPSSDSDDADMQLEIPCEDSGFNNLEKKEEIEFAFNIIDRFYLKKQKRVKPILSDLLTIKFCKQLCALELKTMIELVNKVSFFNKRIIQNYNKTFQLPSQQDVADFYKKDKTNISHTINDFMKEVLEEINNCYS